MSVSAQTAASKPAAAKPAVTVHKTVAAAPVNHCVTIPPISDKIPAVPAGTGCVKPLYVLTRRPDLIVDYADPAVSKELLESLGTMPMTISLLYVDTKIGTGELAKPHMFYSVHYTGYLPDGTKFDSSLDRGEPITFQYGGHNVIAGWDTGFEGMHVGGKRRLFVPYQLAYGDKGHPPVIPAKAELIFDVELVAQSDKQPEPKPAPAPPTPTPAPAAAPAPATSPAGSAAPPPTSSSTPATTAPEKK